MAADKTGHGTIGALLENRSRIPRKARAEAPELFPERLAGCLRDPLRLAARRGYYSCARRVVTRDGLTLPVLARRPLGTILIVLLVARFQRGRTAAVRSFNPREG
jgi:hypothetical protein